MSKFRYIGPLAETHIFHGLDGWNTIHPDEVVDISDEISRAPFSVDGVDYPAETYADGYRIQPELWTEVTATKPPKTEETK